MHGQIQHLTVNTIGGLANRMRSMASAIAIKNMSGAETNIIWAINKDLGAGFEDLFQPVDIPVYTPSAVEYSLKYELPRRRNAYLSGIYQKLFFDRVFTDTDPHFFDLVDKCAFGKYAITCGAKRILVISGADFGDATAECYSKIFRPGTAVEEYLCKRTDLFGEMTVGVHIRRTDHELSILHSPMHLFVERIASILLKYPGAKIFVATDDSECLNVLRDKFGSSIVAITECASRTSKNGMLEGAADMWALSRCKLILGSYGSSFSDMASKLGNTPIEIIGK